MRGKLKACGEIHLEGDVFVGRYSAYGVGDWIFIGKVSAMVLWRFHTFVLVIG